MSDTLRTDSNTLVEALGQIAILLQTDDGVANAAIAEAANRITELERDLAKANAQLDAIKDLFDVEDRLSISVIREAEKACWDSLRLDKLQRYAEVHVSTAKEGADILSFNAWLNKGDDLRQKIDDEMPLDQWDRDNIDDEINREENQND